MSSSTRSKVFPPLPPKGPPAACCAAPLLSNTQRRLAGGAEVVFERCPPVRTLSNGAAPWWRPAPRAADWLAGNPPPPPTPPPPRRDAFARWQALFPHTDVPCQRRGGKISAQSPVPGKNRWPPQVARRASRGTWHGLAHSTPCDIRWRQVLHASAIAALKSAGRKLRHPFKSDIKTSLQAQQRSLNRRRHVFPSPEIRRGRSRSEIFSFGP